MALSTTVLGPKRRMKSFPRATDCKGAAFALTMGLNTGHHHHCHHFCNQHCHCHHHLAVQRCQLQGEGGGLHRQEMQHVLVLQRGDQVRIYCCIVFVFVLISIFVFVLVVQQMFVLKWRCLVQCKSSWKKCHS